MTRKAYPTDLTAAQWTLLEPVLPPAKLGGRPRAADLREVVNALLSLLRTGGPWRSRPHDLPPWPTLERLHDQRRARLRAQVRAQVRQAAGRDPQPRAVIRDRQSVQPVGHDGGQRGARGYDAGKQGSGRQRDASAILSSLPWD